MLPFLNNSPVRSWFTGEAGARWSQVTPPRLPQRHINPGVIRPRPVPRIQFAPLLQFHHLEKWSNVDL